MTTVQAVNYFGGVAFLAEHLGVCRTSIYRWGRWPPEFQQYRITKLTQGRLKVQPKYQHREITDKEYRDKMHTRWRRRVWRARQKQKLQAKWRKIRKNEQDSEILEG